ncbi:hypothetical protein BGW39_005110 [Mortierella sp. 14UC]|nr:hypothetical protein BGW39_005110 [Mortierella sp. 14UC]
MSLPTDSKPTVLIVGAGLGGLMLGALLEKQDVPYTIFERSAVVKPLGSCMSIGAASLPAFEQLAIYDDILAATKPWTHTELHKETLEPHPPHDFRPVEEYTGYKQYMIARPKFYEILLSLVPAHKIHFGKRVLNITEEDGKAIVHTADNSKYEGDIVVGADGAYSAVRQRMYDQLKMKGELPKTDYEELPFSCTSLVGQTKPLDPEEFPIVKEQLSKFRTVLGNNKPYSWVTANTAQNTVTWMVIEHLSKKTSKVAMEQRFRNNDNSEWGAIPAQAMCDETRDFPIFLEKGKRHTLGDLYDQTPKESISKVMLEEKVFSTWYSGRIVLLGDACHKLHPSGGHGAVTAMHDAIAFANLLYALPSKTSTDITRIFQEYKEERLPAVMESFKKSQLLSKNMEKGLVGAFFLYATTRMPLWMWKLALVKMSRFRPQIGFLEPTAVKGTIVPIASPSEKKARAVYEQRKQHVQTTTL